MTPDTIVRAGLYLRVSTENQAAAGISPLTSVRASLESHLMAFAAEEARVEGTMVDMAAYRARVEGEAGTC